MKRTKLCPTCSGAGGEDVRVRISYYDHKLEWNTCVTCDGHGWITPAKHKAYAKRQSAYWQEQAK